MEGDPLHSRPGFPLHRFRHVPQRSGPALLLGLGIGLQHQFQIEPGQLGQHGTERHLPGQVGATEHRAESDTAGLETELLDDAVDHGAVADGDRVE